MNKPEWDETLPGKGDEAWGRATNAERQSAITHATEFIDTLPFKGERLSSNQRLAWPRTGILRDDGAPVSGVPPEIKEAVRLVAGFILAKVPFAPPALGWVFLTIGHLLQDEASLSDSKIRWH